MTKQNWLNKYLESFKKYDIIYLYLPYNYSIAIYKLIEFIDETICNKFRIILIKSTIDSYDDIPDNIKKLYKIIKYPIAYENNKNYLVVALGLNNFKFFCTISKINKADFLDWSNFGNSLIKYKGIHTINNPYKLSFSLYLANGCNFACKGCTYFSCLVPDEEKLLSKDTIFKNIDCLYSKIPIQRIESIHLLGGEPLLNKDLADIAIYLRQKFKDLEIEILTNGFLVPLLDESLFKIFQNNNIKLSISQYKINYDYQKIIMKLNEYGLLKNVIKINNSFNMRFTNNLNYFSFINCDANTVPFIHNCKIYNCNSAYGVQYFNQYFNQKLPEAKGLDLTDPNITYYDIYNYLWEPQELCKHCFGKGISSTEWQPSKKDIYEWIAEDYFDKIIS